MINMSAKVEETVGNTFSPTQAIYPRMFIKLASSRLGKYLVSLDPSILKIHRYMKLYRVTLHKGIQLNEYSSKDVVISSLIIAFLVAYQTRYVAIMLNQPNSKMSLLMGDFLSPLGSARNGLYLGFWAALLQAILSRALILFYGTRKSLSILTDCQKHSLFLYNCRTKSQMNKFEIKLERRLLVLFEFCKATTEGITWAFILFQAFMVLFTARELQDAADRSVCLFWSVTLIPHTFFTASGALVALISSISGVFYTHYKLDLLIQRLEHFQKTQANNDGQVDPESERNLLQLGQMVAMLLGTINRHSKIFSWLLLIYFYFTVLVASSFSYVALYVHLKLDWLRWVTLVSTIQVWLFVIIIPLPVAHVATRTKRLYSQLFSIYARVPLSLSGKLYLKKLMAIVGNAHYPLAYYTADNTPFTLGCHGSVILNVFETLFLIIGFLEN